MNQKRCRSCPHLEFDETTDEMYCKLKDYELIRLGWHKHRPNWCPLVKKENGVFQSKSGTTGNSMEQEGKDE